MEMQRIIQMLVEMQEKADTNRNECQHEIHATKMDANHEILETKRKDDRELKEIMIANQAKNKTPWL
jgi:hypothetical protein